MTTDPGVGYPDRTRRAWEVIQLHYAAQGDAAAGWWVAIRMSDGGSDGELYRSKLEAIHYQLHERQCTYLCLHPFGDMSVREVHEFIEISEKIYNAGGRLDHTDTHIVDHPTAKKGHIL